MSLRHSVALLALGLPGLVSVSHADAAQSSAAKSPASGESVASAKRDAGLSARVPNLDNLASYTLPAAAWSDRHSDIGVTWPNEAKSGVQQLTTFIGWWGSSITDQLLSWDVQENGRPLEVTFRSRNFRPDKVVESDSIGDIDLTATIAFPERNVLAVEFILRNPGSRARTLAFSFDHPGNGVAPDWEGAFPIGLITRIEGASEGSWTTLFQHREHGRNVYGVSQFVAGMTEGTPLELACISDLKSRQLRLEPKSTSRFTVTMAFGRNQGIAQERFDRTTALIKSGWTPARRVGAHRTTHRLRAAAAGKVCRRSHDTALCPRGHGVEQLVRLWTRRVLREQPCPLHDQVRTIHSLFLGLDDQRCWRARIRSKDVTRDHRSLSAQRHAARQSSFYPVGHASRGRRPGANPGLGCLANLCPKPGSCLARAGLSSDAQLREFLAEIPQ